MLIGAYFIYLCVFFLLIAMLVVPLVELFTKKGSYINGKAKAINSRLFWTTPIQMLYLFWLVLACLSWHNMLRPRQNISTMLSVFNLVVMFAFLGYLYYIFFKALSMGPTISYEAIAQEDNEALKQRNQEKQAQRNWIKEHFRFVTKV